MRSSDGLGVERKAGWRKTRRAWQWGLLRLCVRSCSHAASAKLVFMMISNSMVANLPNRG